LGEANLGIDILGRFSMPTVIRDYRDLIVWQRSLQLAKDVFLLCRQFREPESLGLGSQLRRAAISVPSNIAEGCGRGNRREYLRYLRIANGSLKELETQLILARDLQLAPADQFGVLLSGTEEVGRMLTGLRNALKRAR
jgi:four helix bundle protein